MHDNFTDCCLRFDTRLSDCQKNWKYLVQALKELAPDSMTCGLLQVFGEEYSPISVFNETKAALAEVARLAQNEEAEAMLQSEEYDIQVLLERPHMQVSDRVFRMIGLLRKTEKRAGMEIQKLELQLA